MYLPHLSSTTRPVSLRRRVISLSLPVLLSSLLQRLVSIVDIFLVGGVGASAIAATGIGQLLLFVVMTIFWGLGTGVTVVIAHQYGRGEHLQRRRTATASLVVSLSLSLAISLAGWVWGGEMARFLGATDNVLHGATAYIRPVFLLFFFTAGINTLSAVMHGSGETRRPMQAIVLVNIIHILAAIPLIYGFGPLPSRGVVGAAYAINISEASGFLVLLLSAIRQGHLSLSPDFTLFRRVVRVGFPVALERIAQQSGQLLYSKMIISYGTTAYAAHQIGLSIESLSFMPGAGMGIAAAALMGQSLGARKFARARMGHREALRLAVIVMGGMALLFLLLPEQLLSLFTRDHEVIRHGVVFLRLVALAQVPLAISFVYAGSLRGTGDTAYVFYVTLGVMWGVRVLLAWIASRILGMSLYAVWGVFVIDWYVRAFFFARRFHRRDLHEVIL
ncbi:MAG: MATE family efflux transporter [Desulfuromonadia bacterium]